MPINPSELERIDQAIKVQLDILRHSAMVEADILLVLTQMKQELVAKLAQGDITEWSRARLNQLLKDASATIAEYYAKVQEALAPTYATVAGVSAAQTAQALAVTAPSRAVLEALVSNTLIEGAQLKAWWARQSAETHFKFSAAVRQGIAQGETLGQILKRASEATDVITRSSMSVVHTSVMQVMNDATSEVIRQNADVAPKVRWLATLDSHTCPTCAPRDGLEWDTRTHRPIGHDLTYADAPLHINCRCVLIPVTRLTDAAESERASTFGSVSSKMTFAQFLKRQSPEFQDKVLGKGRAELYRKGKITLRDLVSGKGAPLTLEQLNRKYE